MGKKRQHLPNFNFLVRYIKEENVSGCYDPSDIKKSMKLLQDQPTKPEIKKKGIYDFSSKPSSSKHNENNDHHERVVKPPNTTTTSRKTSIEKQLKPRESSGKEIKPQPIYNNSNQNSSSTLINTLDSKKAQKANISSLQIQNDLLKKSANGKNQEITKVTNVPQNIPSSQSKNPVVRSKQVPDKVGSSPLLVVLNYLV